MGSSCSSGSKKDKCSKKHKSDNNGANHSHRGSNASNSSVYVYQKASTAGEEQPPSAASVPSSAVLLAAAPGADGGETPFPTPAAKPRVERTDSHSAVSVSSPMSPTQLLRQTSKDGDQEAGMGRIDLQAVPEHVRFLVTGQVDEGHVWPETPSSRALRIVLCRYGQAGPREQQQIQQEHEALENNVFETLRTHCTERGYELETLILDEGASQEDWGWVLGSQQQLLTIFLLFVSECAPTSSYPLPSHLPAHDGAEDVLKICYERDDNALEPSKKYVLRRDAVVDDQVRGKLRAIYPQETRTGWEWIAEQLSSEPRLCRRTVCVWKRLLQSPYATTPLQQRLLESVDETRLIKCNVKWQDDLSGGIEQEAHQCHMEDLCAQLYPILTSLMESLLDENEANDPTTFGIPSFIGASRRLYSELVEQTRMAHELFRAFPEDRENSTVEAIRDYLQSDVPWPLVVHGGVGSGKSRAIAASAHSCHSQWLPSAHVVFRFAHKTPESQSVDRLLISVIEQCCLLLGEPRPSGVQAADLPGLLQRLAPARPLIVLLDGLDFLVPSVSPASNLQWLPTILPDNVRLVLTVTNPSPIYDHLRSILALDESTEAGFVAVPPLSECRAFSLLQSQLLAKGRQLTQKQQQTWETAVTNLPNPMYVSLVAHCAFWITSSHSSEAPPLQNSLENQAEVLLENLEEELDPSLLSSTFAYILLSKHGLSNAELSNLMLRSLALKKGSYEESLWNQKMTLFIHRLCDLLSPAYLKATVVGDRNLLHIPCHLFSACLRKRYLGVQEQRTVLHTSLKEFWESCEMQFGTRFNRRKLEELPRLSKVPLERFVFDWNWVFSKVCGSLVDELLEDIAEAEVPPEIQPEVDELVRFLQASLTTLTYDGHQFFSQVHARLLIPSPTPESGFTHLLKLLELSISCLPTPSLLCPKPASHLTSPASPASPEVPQKIAFTSLHRIKDDPSFVVSLSPTQNEVVVWNIYTQEEERRFRGIIQPRDIKFIDEYKVVILCNRELCIYDLNEGSFLVKLKGVMNQKMAYYDMHNSDHVVSLSRNRMYVNMMNLSTGDCVATFKVGEDRFLNSLLVSANGRICVCGDETQKPFPLLVWDLSNRKLLYDLRIPHHDFVTNLSAITSDGHYVVCICQEVSDPSPNFIIVYDLQNGTLFKKWKPDVSTCSVAISSEGGCVITGLVDTSILVWDLATGACRYTLQGHTAPVTVIRLDNNGHRCLTADLPKQRDPAIRLWDLSKGICLASFMGDSPITCCELTSNGEAVVLGLADSPTILTLMLVDEGFSISDALPPLAHYGNSDYYGKQVDFSDKGG